MHHRSISILALAAPLLLGAAGAQATQYQLSDLGIDSSGVKMDGFGDVVGTKDGFPAYWNLNEWNRLENAPQYQVSALNFHNNSVGWEDLDEPRAIEWLANGTSKFLIHDSIASVATIIQQDSTIYGASLMPTGHSFPYSLKKNKLTRLPYLNGYDWTVPLSVNRFGEVAGFAGAAPSGSICPAVPAIYVNGAWTSLGLLGGSCGQANGLNDGDVVIGQSTTSGFYSHAFIYQNGHMSDLGTLKANENSTAWDITSDGVIVGDSGANAFVYANGRMTALSKLVVNLPSGVKLQSARAINSDGVILVNGVDKSNHQHAYELTPL